VGNKKRKEKETEGEKKRVKKVLHPEAAREEGQARKTGKGTDKESVSRL